MRFTPRQTGWLAVGLLLVACQPDPAPDTAAGAGTAPAGAAAESPIQRAGSVTIEGGEDLTGAPLWQIPQVKLAQADVKQALAQADAALAAGRLYEDAQAAIPIYLAVRTLQPADTGARNGLRLAIAALHAHARRVLERADDVPDALREAHTLIAVLLAVDPNQPATTEYLAQVERADRLWALNSDAEDDIRAGRFGVQAGGALTALREVLRLKPGQARALQGIAAVESGLIAQAEQAAAQGDFTTASHWLTMAAQVRAGSPSIDDAQANLQVMRLRQIARLRDQGLDALGKYDGVRKARDYLARMLRIVSPGEPAAAELRKAIDLAAHYGQFRPGQVFSDQTSDGGDGPRMVVIPHGAFWMGAPDRDPVAAAYEKPARYIRFERGFAMSSREISVGQFRHYLMATKARTRSVRRGYSMPYDERAVNFVRRSGVDTDSDYLGRWADDNLPVVHLSAADADGYARWLSGVTGHSYRLPSEAEYEYALRAGGTGRYPWGDVAQPPRRAGNLTGGGDRSPGGRAWDNAFAGYEDMYWGPAPGGSFQANPFGLYDMAGNVNEWVADCWHDSYQRAPKDARPWYNPGCRIRVIRGGAWSSSPLQFRSTWRAPIDVDTTNAQIGFRVVRDL